MFKPKSPSKYFLRHWKNRKYFQKNRLRHSESQPHRLVVVFEVICMNGMESGDPKVLFSLKTFIFDTFYRVSYYLISTRYRFRFIHANPLAIPPNGSYDRELFKKPKISKNERAAAWISPVDQNFSNTPRYQQETLWNYQKWEFSSRNPAFCFVSLAKMVLHELSRAPAIRGEPPPPQPTLIHDFDKNMWNITIS